MGRYDPEELVQDVGRRVRELRLAQGWTQNDLAMRLRAAVQRVQNIERGSENLTLFSLARLANAFDVPMATFFELPEETHEPRRQGRPPRKPVPKDRKEASEPSSSVGRAPKKVRGRRSS